jgi:sugar phosphate isomerase/epimerase
MKRILLCDAGDYKKVSQLCEKHKLGVNIDIDIPEHYLQDNPNEINDIMEGYKNVEINSINGSFTDLNFTSDDPLIREITLKRFEYAYEISCKLRCKNIVLHNGHEYDRPQSLAVGVFMWEHFLRDKDKETIFYIENRIEKDPLFINSLIEAVNKHTLKICFDIGNAHIYSEIKITEWIKKLNTNIGFVHLHNNYGKAGKQNGLGNGEINISEICAALEQHCPNAIWEIETSEYEDSIKWLIENKYIN